jgi:hypothetical protein
MIVVDLDALVSLLDLTGVVGVATWMMSPRRFAVLLVTSTQPRCRSW